MIIVIPLYPVFWALHPIHKALRRIFPKIRPWQTAIIIVAALFAGLPLLGQAQAADFATVPDPTLTPGAVRTIDPVEICTHSTREFRHWSREADDRILIEYGLLPIPTKPPVCNGMIAPRDSWMMPPPCNEMIPPGAPRVLA
jgi:hypothetical protein